MAATVDDYGASGTQLIWVADPARRTVMVVVRDAPMRLLHESDTLDGRPVLPGFICAVSAIFEGIATDLQFPHHTQVR